jgi:hypothetical protein
LAVINVSIVIHPPGTLDVKPLPRFLVWVFSFCLCLSLLILCEQHLRSIFYTPPILGPLVFECRTTAIDRSRHCSGSTFAIRLPILLVATHLPCIQLDLQFFRAPLQQSSPTPVKRGRCKPYYPLIRFHTKPLIFDRLTCVSYFDAAAVAFALQHAIDLWPNKKHKNKKQPPIYPLLVLPRTTLHIVSRVHLLSRIAERPRPSKLPTDLLVIRQDTTYRPCVDFEGAPLSLASRPQGYWCPTGVTVSS